MYIPLHSAFETSSEALTAQQLTSACVHCGFCLATCPTYLDSRDERDSPRGRIYLIKQLLETGTASVKTHTHLDRCLSCHSCETTCPSGMQYGQLLDIGRGLMEQRVPRPWFNRLQRALLRYTLSRPALFTGALRVGQLLRPVLPAQLRRLVPARQTRRALPVTQHPRRMLMLDGCVQRAATPATNDAARRILDKLGISVQTAAQAGCCGAVNYHLAAHEQGLDNMRRNIDAWWPAIENGVEAIVSCASGCGSVLADYGRLLAHDPNYAAKAGKVSALVRDIGEVLLVENLSLLHIKTDVGKIAVQTPCTLQHALQQPELISRILTRCGFTLATTTGQHLCCGSAGTYSVLQRDISVRLRANKIHALSRDKPSIIATGNVGCQLHLQAASEVPVVHWIELLDAPSNPVI